MRLQEKLNQLKDAGLYRTLRTVDGEQGPRIKIDGREVLLLCSNNYLGLASHPYVKEAAKRAIDRYGLGAGASRLVSGTMKAHIELEERLAAFKGRESALVFNSGYHANIGLITALLGRGDYCISDKLNHASIIDGCLLSGANFKRYPHKDMNALEEILRSIQNTKNSRLIITEGIFSMDGDIAPLKELVWLKERYGAMLMIDDAHGTGVMGNKGRGTIEHLGIDDDSIIEMGTLGKALGSFGAFVAGRKELIEFIINKARSFIYTTALPPSICAASIAALDIVEKEPERRSTLLKKASYFRGELKAAGFNTLESEAHIIPVLIGDNRLCLEISQRLLSEGVFIQAIRPPTVPDGTSRLRISLIYDHDMKDIDYALEVLKKIGDATLIHPRLGYR